MRIGAIMRTGKLPPPTVKILNSSPHLYFYVYMIYLNETKELHKAACIKLKNSLI